MELGLTGWVANEPDGAVRCVAEGAARSLERCWNASSDGPPPAIVERVSAAWMPATDSFGSFGCGAARTRGD